MVCDYLMNDKCARKNARARAHTHTHTHTHDKYRRDDIFFLGVKHIARDVYRPFHTHTQAVQLMFMRHGKSFSQDEIKSVYKVSSV